MNGEWGGERERERKKDKETIHTLLLC